MTVDKAAVQQVRARWRIGTDEWWRERPVARHYYEVVQENGQVTTVFFDKIGKEWFRQTYA